MRRAGLFAIALLSAALFLGTGGAPARAAGPPSLQIEVIGAGTVTGTGISCGQGSLSCYASYGSATPVALTAAPATGWTFSGWEDDASACAAVAANCLVTPADPAATATAVFTNTGALPTATLNVSTPSGGTSAPASGAVTNGSTDYPIDCDPTGSGATTCSLTVLQDSTITVAESPGANSFFNGWGGACSGTNTGCAVYLSGNATVSANFVGSSPVELTVVNSGGGTVTGAGISCASGATCDAQEVPNSTVTLTESAASGYAFTGWTTGCSGTQSTCTVQMDQARTVTATFSQLVPLTVSASGNGSVSGAGISSCSQSGGTCTAGEAPNATVTLTASPDSGASVYWSGCASSSGNTCTVTMSTTATSVSATFSGGTGPSVATNSLTVSVTGDGYVTALDGSAAIYCTAAGGAGCTANVPAGATVTLNALPASGVSANFTAWSGDCITSATTSCTLTMNGAKSAGATFAGGNTTYVLTGRVSGSGSITGAGLNCTGTGAGCSAAQAAGASVTLTAVPSFGATFAGWSGACTGTSATCTVTMSVARSVTATFAKTSLGSQSLAIQVTGAGSVKAPGGTCSSTAGKTKLCTQSYDTGKAVTLTAKAAAGFAFSGWKGGCTGAKTTCKVTLTSFTDVAATFGRAVLASTRKPAVAKTKTGHRITLFFAVHERGSLKLVGKLGTKTVVSRTSKVAAGSRRLVVSVAKPGRYVFTLTLTASGKHSIRWTVKI
jgi:uncharacterized repeat protein (TIGR02543 family)